MRCINLEVTQTNPKNIIACNTGNRVTHDNTTNHYTQGYKNDHFFASISLFEPITAIWTNE